MVKEGSAEASLTVVEKGLGGFRVSGLGLVVCLVKGLGFRVAKLSSGEL